MKNALYISALLLGILLSCTEELDVDLPEYPAEIVVDGYLNTAFAHMNYVVLTRAESYSVDNREYFVTDADVLITPGEEINGSIQWREGEQVQFLLDQEILDSMNFAIYRDRFNNLPVEAGNHYRLDVFAGEDTLYAETFLPAPVQFEGNYISGGEPGQERALVTVNFTDPPETSNFYRQALVPDNATPILWGDIRSNILYSDRTFRGRDTTVAFQWYFSPGDVIGVYLLSLDRISYEVMQSNAGALNSDLPMMTPASPGSNIRGGRGGFFGIGVSAQRVEIGE